MYAVTRFLRHAALLTPLMLLGLGATLSPANGLKKVAAPTARAHWFPVSHDAGQAWAWTTDPSFRVLLVEESHDEWTFGLYFLYGDTVHATWVEDLGGEGVDRYLYLLLGVPRDDGTPPLVSSRRDLVLALQGSGEHGCDALGADEVTIRIRPTLRMRSVEVRVQVEGVVYLGFPADGVYDVSGEAIDPDDPTAFFVADMEPGVDSYEYTNFTGLIATGTSLGPLELSCDPPLPWFQLQRHEGLLEVDMDHSCEDPGFEGASLTLVTRVPTGPRGLHSRPGSK